MKFYKTKNPNTLKISNLFVIQVVLGALPTVLSAVYVFYIQPLEISADYEEYGYTLWIGLLFVSLVFLAFTAYVIAARRYSVLVSGLRGEKMLEKIVKKLNGDYVVFANLPVRYKNNRSEIDLLIISERGILTVEVKNHSGAIIGSAEDEFWIHRKYYRAGKITETEMKNPLKQVKRQREILKNILRSNGIEVWIDSVLFFSSNPSLKTYSDSSDISIVSNAQELLSVINNYEHPEEQAKKIPTREQCDEIVRVLRELEV
jgi:hypothetical protein